MYKHLTLVQRYQIEALHAQGLTISKIALAIGVHKSTISRELRRNSIQSARPPDRYKAAIADDFCKKRAYKPLNYKTKDPRILRRMVWLLRRGWSPQQICQVCRNRGVAMLSTEAIYLWLYKQKRLATTYAPLVTMLRRAHRKRRKRLLQKGRRDILKDKVSIAKRPQLVQQQTRCGDLEADLVKCQNGYLLTITDRKTLFNFITKLPNKEADTVADAIVKTLKPYKGAIFTITSDNGTEFARHQQIAQALQIQWYFADPYCSQQRGCNENQNGLIRQYFTRKTNLNLYSDNDIKTIERILNHRPRKKNQYLPPIKLFLHPSPVALVA